jgi:hypothetical protein
MDTPEYTQVFGREPYPLKSDETIIDVGSGWSNLSTLCAVGKIVQIDPVYSEQATLEHITRIPAELGTRSPQTARLVSQLCALQPTRVTSANMLMAMGPEERTITFEQMLRMGAHGIVQVYPFRQRHADFVSQAANEFGFDTMVTRAGLRDMRQKIYLGLGINHTLTIQPRRGYVGPRERRALAKSITQALKLGAPDQRRD